MMSIYYNVYENNKKSEREDSPYTYAGISSLSLYI